MGGGHRAAGRGTSGGRPAAAPAPAGASAHPVAGSLLSLQRAAGNRATCSALGHRRLQRYTVTTNYGIDGPGAAAPLFSSQHIAHDAATGAPEFKRVQTHADAGGALHVTQQHVDMSNPAPAPGAMRGVWVNDAGPAQALGAAKPAIKLSANQRIAVENVAQPRVFFIDPWVVDNFNKRLERVRSKVRIFFTGGPGIRIGTRVLRQASVAAVSAPGAVAARLSVECNDLAALVIGEGINPAAGAYPGVAPADAGARAGVGQAYALESDKRFKGFATTKLPSRPLEREAAVQMALDGWRRLEERLRAAATDFDPTITPEAKGLGPGWGTHFEGVIAIDGSDSLTLANYNRVIELNYERRVLSRELIAMVPEFERAFMEDVKTSPPADWGELSDRLEKAVERLSAGLVDDLPRRAAQKLASFSAVAADQAGAMYYFELYGGAAGQSFHERYEWASRGYGGHTRVLDAKS